MLLCDLDLLAAEDKLPKFLAALEPFKELIYFHLLVVGLYLGGVPSYEMEPEIYNTLLKDSPGWKWLSWFKPQAVFDFKWFYLFWAALLTVAAIPRLPWLKHFFETRFCQYLARVSFALYLVHGPVMVVLGDRLYAAVGLKRNTHEKNIPNWINKFPLPTKGPFGLELAFWATQLILLPVTLYCAEIVMRMFDEPSVRISNWFYRKTLPAPPQSPAK
jgi:peptidoglycan/LPS O-acetylase OafA/YrhL